MQMTWSVWHIQPLWPSNEIRSTWTFERPFQELDLRTYYTTVHRKPRQENYICKRKNSNLLKLQKPTDPNNSSFVSLKTYVCILVKSGLGSRWPLRQGEIFLCHSESTWGTNKDFLPMMFIWRFFMKEKASASTANDGAGTGGKGGQGITWNPPQPAPRTWWGFSESRGAKEQGDTFAFCLGDQSCDRQSLLPLSFCLITRLV